MVNLVLLKTVISAFLKHRQLHIDKKFDKRNITKLALLEEDTNHLLYFPGDYECIETSGEHV